jgi:hypothetical protein
VPNPPPRVTPKRTSTYTSRHKSLCAQYGTKHDDHAYKKRRLNPDHDSVGIDTASTSADVDNGSTASCFPSVRAWNTKRKTNNKIQVLRKKLFAVQQKLKILEENLKQLFNDDQLNALKTPTRKVPCWSEATIKKHCRYGLLLGQPAITYCDSRECHCQPPPYLKDFRSTYTLRPTFSSHRDKAVCLCRPTARTEKHT